MARPVKIPEAKPCPFCGGTHGFVECMGGATHRFWCNGCVALGPPVENGTYTGAGDERAERDPTKAWNKRRHKPTEARP
jgi:hypothetical protein